MRISFLFFAAWTACLGAVAQGTVNFVNKITGAVDARVMYAGAVPGSSPYQGAVGGGSLPETMFVAQLWQLSGSAGPVGDPIPFRSSDPGTGYWVGATRTLNGVAENSQATLKVVAWSTAFGATYEIARQTHSWGGSGESAPITITTGGGLNPPASMVGLQGFAIGDINFPEPSASALLLLGAALLGIRMSQSGSGLPLVSGPSQMTAIPKR